MRIVDTHRCDAPFACLPTSTAAGGVHPWFISLLLGVAVQPEYEYDVVAETDVPRLGRVTTTMRVRLSQLHERDADGARLVRMLVDPGASATDQHGSVHRGFASELRLEAHPFYFWQTASGTHNCLVICSSVQLVTCDS